MITRTAGTTRYSAAHGSMLLREFKTPVELRCIHPFFGLLAGFSWVCLCYSVVTNDLRARVIVCLLLSIRSIPVHFFYEF